MTVNLQYVGFKSKAIVREYSFLLRESSLGPYEITFAILNEAFCSHGLRNQDAPALCSLKLHRKMANSVDDPLKTHCGLVEPNWMTAGRNTARAPQQTTKFSGIR